MPKQRIVGYARVSKQEQAENSHALEQQIQRLKDAGAEKVFFDVESAHKNKTREQLEDLLELVAAKKVDKVIITRIDRMSRRGSKSFSAFETFTDADVSLEALDQPFDLRTASGRMVAGMLAVVGQTESDIKVEATRAGTAYRRSQKKAFHPPFGYVMGEDGKLRLNKEGYICLLSDCQGNGEVIEGRSQYDLGREYIEAYISKRSLSKALQLVNERYGLNQISKTLTRPGFPMSRSGLRRWLSNPALRGHLQYLKGKQTVWNTHPDQRMMSDQEWQHIQEIIELNVKQKGWGSQFEKKNPLSGLVHCDVCQASMYASKGGNRYGKPRPYYYYYCHRAPVGNCENTKWTSEQVIENALIDALVARADAIANSVALDLEANDTINPRILNLQQQISRTEQLIKQSSGDTSFLVSHIRMLRSQIEQIENQPSDIDHARRDELAAVGSDPEFWHETLTQEDKMALYPHFTKGIWVRDKQVVRIELKV